MSFSHNVSVPQVEGIRLVGDTHGMQAAASQSEPAPSTAPAAPAHEAGASTVGHGDLTMQIPGRSGPRQNHDDGRPKHRRTSESSGGPWPHVPHGSAEHGPGRASVEVLSMPATPRASSKRRTASPEAEDVLPAFGQRLLRCEQWIGKLDEHCDQGGIAGYKNLQLAAIEIAKELR